MRGSNLAIYQGVTPCLQMLDQMDKSNLGGITASGKHGLAEEYLSEAEPVEASHQFALAPTFDRMSISHRMQTAVCFNHVIRKPSPAARQLRGSAQHWMTRRNADVRRHGEDFLSLRSCAGCATPLDGQGRGRYAGRVTTIRLADRRYTRGRYRVDKPVATALVIDRRRWPATRRAP